MDIPLDFIKKNAGDDIQVDYFPIFEDGFNDEGVLRNIWASSADIRLTAPFSVRCDGDYAKDKFDGSMVL